MKLLLLLLQCLPSLIHYTTSSPKVTPSWSGRETSTRCPCAVCYRGLINGSKDGMLLMSTQNQKTGFIQASSSLWVPRIWALNPLFCSERCMWMYGGGQVWWIVQPFSFSCLSCFSKVTLLAHFAWSWAAPSYCLCSAVVPLKSQLCSLGPFPCAWGWERQHSLHCPPKVFLMPPGKFERVVCHSPAICFPSQTQGYAEVCEALQGFASSSRVSEVQIVHQKLLCRSSAPSASLRPHGGDRGLGMRQGTGVRQPDVLGEGRALLLPQLLWAENSHCGNVTLSLGRTLP